MTKWLALILAFCLMFHKPTEQCKTNCNNAKSYDKVVDYLANKYFKEKEVIKQYVNISVKEANKHNIDPLLVLAIIETESSFNTRAYNQSGAQGLMQVIPKYHTDLITDYHQSLFDPNVGISVGIEVLMKFLWKHNGDYVKALNNYGGDRSGNYYNIVMKKLQKIKEYDI